jgi:CcmD family protein
MGKFLFAAYAITWLIHLSYVCILGRGYKRIHAEMNEHRSGSSSDESAH